LRELKSHAHYNPNSGLFDQPAHTPSAAMRRIARSFQQSYTKREILRQERLTYILFCHPTPLHYTAFIALPHNSGLQQAGMPPPLLRSSTSSRLTRHRSCRRPPAHALTTAGLRMKWARCPPAARDWSRSVRMPRQCST